MGSTQVGKVWINPWSLAASLGRREGRWRIPRGGIAPAPGQNLLREFGNADQAKQGYRWYRKEPRLSGRCHKAARKSDLAALKTRAAGERLGRRARLIERFYARLDATGKALHRGLGNVAYVSALTVFVFVEGSLNRGALLLLGETNLQLLYALALGLAQLYLAKSLGQGLRGREMGAPDAPSRSWIWGLATASLALILALAILRAEALHIAIRVAVSESVANTAGATVTTTAPVDMPASSWLWYGLLQLGVFMAACTCSWLHANWLTDEREKLARAYKRARWHLNWRLFCERLAAVSSDRARGRWAAGFAHRLEEADEAAHYNLATQAKYAHANLRSRKGEIDDIQVLDPLSLAEKVWRKTPDPAERIGTASLPLSVPRWVEFSVPAPQIAPAPNGNGGEAQVVSFPSKEA